MTTFTTKKIFASAPFTQRGENIVLGGDPKGKNFLYTNATNVFIRDIENPVICDVYLEHSYQTTVAKYSPSGFYIASADVRGNLRIWDTVNPEHVLKYEYQPLSGAIRDIAWSPDSKRLIIAGDGRERFAVAIMADTGTSVGTLIGNSKNVKSCDMKQTRPFRVVTGGDDHKVCFYEGPPFKYKASVGKHTNFVSSTRYAPCGDVFCSADMGGRCFLYDGKTGEYKSTFGCEDVNAHSGGIYGTAWSGDSKQLLTVSGDKTAKIWDVETNQVVTEFVLGTEIRDQQVSCLWQNNYILSVSLSGNINYLDPCDPSKPVKILKGHQRTIEDLTLSSDKSKIFAGSFDGTVNSWNVHDGVAESAEGSTPQLFSQMALYDNKLCTIAKDDTLRLIDTETMQYTDAAIGLDTQPRGVARGAGNLTVVAGIEKLTVFRDEKKASVLDVVYNATAVDIHPNQSEIAVGGNDEQLHIYTLLGDTLQEKKCFTAFTGEISKCRYSPNGEYLVATSSSKRVDLWKVFCDYEPLNYNQYNHNAKVFDVAWSPDNQHYATACLDGTISIWNVAMQRADHTVKGIHGRGGVNCLRWLDEKTIASGGADCCIRISEVVFK